ncbi:GNAT family N-acetyltransferase [Puia sp. P3]|uniref:GNAT family N-acetyltransferase n=1 Tax=Puia sp. P3 TaxID=3423952 RepID=UPI003D66EC67
MPTGQPSAASSTSWNTRTPPPSCPADSSACSETRQKQFWFGNPARRRVASSPSRSSGFLSLHFIPQIALPGDFARISYFAVDSSTRGNGIGRQMEEYATQLAREKGCELIEVHLPLPPRPRPRILRPSGLP